MAKVFDPDIGKETRFRAGDEQAKIASLGGKQSQKVQAEKKTMCEWLEIALAKTVTNNAGETLPVKAIGMVSLANKYAKGDVKAVKLVAELMRELTQDINVNIPNPISIDKATKQSRDVLMEKLNGDDNGV